MTKEDKRDHFLFPSWSNLLRPGIVIGVLGGALYVTIIVTYGFSPKTTDVGYQPEQPVPYSHALHVGQLGLDCRYCHNTVERTAFASLPPTQTCMNCHKMIRTKSPKLTPVFTSYATGVPVEWVKVHDLPDYVYFNHSAHVTHGVGCETCHGRIDTMETVYQAEPLSMGWCLNCHRNPEKYLRPPAAVTEMGYKPAEGQLTVGRRVRRELNINPRTDCYTCHR